MHADDLRSKLRGYSKKQDLDAETLKSVLRYDPISGDFYCLVRFANGKNRVGDKVGTNSRGYWQIRVGSKFIYKAHRLAWLYMTGNWPIADVDHIDMDKSNNRWSNLRDVSRSVNKQNIGKALSRTTSGLLGAHWNKRDEAWTSMITYDGKVHYLGTFETAKLAHEAYITAKRQHHEGCTI